MKKITASIQYVSPCLGQIQKKGSNDYYAFPRDPKGHVMIMQSWIRAALKRAITHLLETKTLEDSQCTKTLPQRILLETTTVPSDDVLTRDMADGRSITYDCIRTGTKITLCMLLPYGIPTEHLRLALVHVGKYVGLSPRHAGEGYGRFEVLSFECNDYGQSGSEQETPDQDDAQTE